MKKENEDKRWKISMETLGSETICSKEVNIKEYVQSKVFSVLDGLESNQDLTLHIGIIRSTKSMLS